VLLTTPFDAWHGLFVEHRYYRPLLEGAVVSCVYIGVWLAVAWTLFHDCDVAGAGSERTSRRTPLLVAGAAALVAVALAVASNLGPTAITPKRLAGAITPTFENLVLLQQRQLGRTIRGATRSRCFRSAAGRAAPEASGRATTGSATSTSSARPRAS
jgi:hypothetical protein